MHPPSRDIDSRILEALTRRYFLLLTAGGATALAAAPPQNSASSTMLLRENWAIQSSAGLHETGAALSKPGFDTRDWYAANLPSTVLSALVRDRVYPNPYFGMNLRKLPGSDYPSDANFSNVMMPPDSPFRPAWWYRTEFQMPAAYRGRTVWLNFDGINYRANLWLNGRQVASSQKFAGTWRLFQFEVTSDVRPGETNALAVEVFPPEPTDLAMTFVDWAPMPPDKEMGIWRDVSISVSGPVAVRYPAVFTKLNLPSTDRAQLTVRVELQNAKNEPVEGILKGQIEEIHFSQKVKLNAGETRAVHLDPAAFPQLTIANPRLWWPVQTGPQNLYPLDLHFETDGQVSDSSNIHFGIRQVTSEIDAKGHRLFHINGKKILIRGAGYSFDLLLRSSPQHQEAELNYVRDLNLNALRMEGKLADDHFLDLCDRYGIIALPGWCCCDEWQFWKNWGAENYRIAAACMRDQARRLGSHPSVFAFLYGSDHAPPPRAEKMFLKALQEADWPNPTIAAASKRTTTVGPTGVKMTGPYDYVPPDFWYLDKHDGGAFGFNTETSPGAAIPPIESLRRMLPPDHLWPIDSWWNFHTRGPAHNLDLFTTALEHRYGSFHSAEECARKAQVQSYETHRAMFEAYRRNKFTSTGIIQWMLNNAWPSMIWHLYDWYLRPGGSYFGAKHANEPLHIQYSYDDRSIVVVNSYYKAFPALKVAASVYNLDMTKKFSKEATIDIAANSSTRVFVLPDMKDLSTTYFVDLTLHNSGHLASRNFYWLSTTPDTLDWERQTWYFTPTKTFADHRALNTLPEVALDASATTQRGEKDSSTTVTLHNPSHTLAFGIRLKVNRAQPRRVSAGHGFSDYEILPVLWQDNYFSLLPGETRTVNAAYNTKALRHSNPVVEVEGWNIKRKVIKPG